MLEVLVAWGLTLAAKLIIAALIMLASFALAVVLKVLVKKVKEWKKGRIIVVDGPEGQELMESLPKLRDVMRRAKKPKAVVYTNESNGTIEKIGAIDALNTDVDELGDMASIEKDGRTLLYD